MARAARVSTSHLSRIVKKLTMRSPQQFLCDARREKAGKLLRDPLLSVKEVARKCGFVNQNHFSTWFLKHFKQSPSAFRAQIERKEHE
jgi:AraC-like DNA-binding protein